MLMLKQYFIATIFCCLGGFAFSQVPYQIKGTWENGHGKKVYLNYFPSGSSDTELLDSTTIAPNGSYVLAGNLPKMQLLSLSHEGSKGYLMLMGDGIPVNVLIKNVKYSYKTPSAAFEIKGDTIEHKAAAAITKFFGDEFIRKISEGMATGGLNQAIEKNDPVQKAENEEKLRALQQEREDQKKNFLAQYSNCLAAPFFIEMNLIKESPIDEICDFFNKLGKAAQASAKGIEIKQTIDKTKALAFGATAPDFTLSTVTGEKLSLKDLRGHIVLLDFWASWCGPCMAEMPTVKKIYEKYKSQGLKVVGISMDNVKPSWTKAIAKANLPWVHISSLKGMQKCPVAQLYQVHAIPKLYIIDKQGKIIAKDLRGELLEKKMEELFVQP